MRGAGSTSVLDSWAAMSLAHRWSREAKVVGHEVTVSHSNAPVIRWEAQLGDPGRPCQPRVSASKGHRVGSGPSPAGSHTAPPGPYRTEQHRPDERCVIPSCTPVHLAICVFYCRVPLQPPGCVLMGPRCETGLRGWEMSDGVTAGPGRRRSHFSCSFSVVSQCPCLWQARVCLFFFAFYGPVALLRS